MERSIGDGGKTGRSPGRALISRKTIARGKPGCPGCTCSSTRVLSFTTFAHGTAGAVGARLSLRPLIQRGTTNWQNPDNPCRGNADVCARPGGKTSWWKSLMMLAGEPGFEPRQTESESV